jgi:hypothetical protein
MRWVFLKLTFCPLFLQGGEKSYPEDTRRGCSGCGERRGNSGTGNSTEDNEHMDDLALRNEFPPKNIPKRV